MKLLSFIQLLGIWLFLNKCDSDHFNSGTVSAKPVRDFGDLVEYEFTTRLSFTRSRYARLYCNSTYVYNRMVMTESMIFRCRAGCHSSWLANYTVFDPARYVCTSYSVLNDWNLGERKQLVNVTKTGNFEASNYAEAWRTLKLRTPGAGRFWEIRIKLNSTQRADTQTINITPRTLVPPVIVLRIGIMFTLDIPMYDDDAGDTMRCRWAQSALGECAAICQTVPMATLNSNPCQMNFNLTALTSSSVGWYGAALQIEDFATASSVTPMSSIPVQFLINVVNFNGSCFNNPDIVVEPCVEAQVGVLFSRKLFANANCPNVTITEIVVTGPAGMYTLDTYQDAVDTRNSYTTIYWIPDIEQIGYNMACSVATDSEFQSSKLACMSIFVGTGPVSSPELVDGSGYPMNTLTPEFLTGINGFMTFRASFNIDVTRPSKSTYVYIVDINDNVLIKYDCSTSAFVYYINNMIFIDVPVETIPIGNYFIKFDNSTAVGTGYCKSISPAKTKSFWPISVVATSAGLATSSDTPTACVHESSGCNISSLLFLLFIFWIVFILLHLLVLFGIMCKYTGKRMTSVNPVYFTLHVPSSYKYNPQ